MSKYKHIRDEDLDAGKEISEILEDIDELGKDYILIYAKGIKDGQKTGKEESRKSA